MPGESQQGFKNPPSGTELSRSCCERPTLRWSTSGVSRECTRGQPSMLTCTVSGPNCDLTSNQPNPSMDTQQPRPWQSIASPSRRGFDACRYSAGSDVAVCRVSPGGWECASRPFTRQQDGDLLRASPFRVLPTRAPGCLQDCAPWDRPTSRAALQGGRILRGPDPHVTAS